jgi:hypothetical protein
VRSRPSKRLKRHSELRQGLLEVGPRFANVHESSLQRIHEHAIKQQHGTEVFQEIEAIEEGIKVAEAAIVAAREEIALDCGGLKALDEAAKPYEQEEQDQRRRSSPEFQKRYMLFPEEVKPNGGDVQPSVVEDSTNKGELHE